MISRIGFKRAFAAFWTARNLTPLFLVFAPALLAASGLRAAFILIAATLLAFALFRTISENALLSWQQEYVPHAIQGRFFASSNIFVNLVSVLAVWGAGAVVGGSTGLGRFTFLFLVGTFFGLLSAWSFTHVPGGSRPGPAAPSPGEPGGPRSPLASLHSPLGDRRYRFFLTGVALVVLGTSSLTPFLPLYMAESIGLAARQVVWLQTGTLLGGLASSFLWGWAADRYGSKPVMISGICLLAALPPLWFLLPRQSPLSFPLGLGISFLQGVGSLGWGIGLTRFLFVGVVPPQRKVAYIALYYTWVSLSSGISSLLGGWILDLGRGIGGQFGVFVVDPYALLFVVGLVLPVAGAGFFSTVQVEARLTTPQFAGLFLRGNPLLALGSLARFSRARSERAAVASTAGLGQARSPLTVEELLEALQDARFNVRFEAIVSIARRDPDPRLLVALAEVLSGPDPALSVIAAWALGRLGDPAGIPALHEGLDSPYRSVQGHCARALGALADAGSAGLLLERLENEPDPGLQLAYASALGHLHETRAAARLLALLASSAGPSARQELALALARLLGAEPAFVQLLRQAVRDPGPALSRAASEAQKHLQKLGLDLEPAGLALARAVDCLGRDDLEAGTAEVTRAGRALARLPLAPPHREILSECASCPETNPAAPREYLILTLCALQTCQVIKT